MKAPAVSVKTCSQAFNTRSRAFGISSSAAAAIHTMTPSVTAHNAPLIHKSNLNIGLMVMLGFLAFAKQSLNVVSVEGPLPVKRAVRFRFGQLRNVEGRRPVWRRRSQLMAMVVGVGLRRFEQVFPAIVHRDLSFAAKYT
jgi:hypothetical protein